MTLKIGRNKTLDLIMKKYNLVLLLLSSFIFVGSCKSQSNKNSEKMSIAGYVKKIHSSCLKEDRELWIYIPDSVSVSEISDFPVVYLLDPESHFNDVVRMIQLFGGKNGEGLFNRMVVVGIPTPDRIRDFTPSFDPSPSESSTLPVKDSNFGKSGGAGNFTIFIEKEVVPYIETTYHTSDMRILVGHSFGGLMTVNTLLNFTELFDAYIAIDPSNWWNHQESFRKAREIIEKKSFAGRSFFYANSNTSKEFAMKLTDSLARNPYHSQLQFGSLFAEHKKNMPYFEWIHYDLENHGSIPLIAIFDGLRIMSDYFENNHSKHNSQIVSERIEANERAGFSRSVNEVIMNVGILSTKNMQYSSDNVNLRLSDDTLHTSKNLLYVVGELSILRGDTAGALECFRKSLSLDPGSKKVILKISEIEQMTKK